MDSDLTCPLDHAALADFQAKLTAMSRKLANGALDSSQFVVSQFGSVPTYARALTREERASQGGTGPCDFMTPDGRIAPDKVRRLENAIHAYEGALEAACDEVPQCTYDGGAFGASSTGATTSAATSTTSRSEGHAKAAAVAWQAMMRTHVLPR